MDCNYCRVRKTAFRQNVLPQQEKKLVDKHLKKCPSCRQFLTGAEAGQLVKEKDSSRKMSRLQKIFLAGTGLVFLIATLLIVGQGGKGGIWGGKPLAGQESLEEINNFGIGSKVMASAENSGVKVTVTHAIADDLQTIIHYKVEDLEQDRKLWIDPRRNSDMIERGEIWNRGNFEVRNISKIENYQNRGRLSLPPIKEGEAEIAMKLNKLAVVNNQQNPYASINSNLETIEGEWKFTIPVKKTDLKEYKLDIETEVEGVPLQIDKVTIAPTATLISYRQKVQNQVGRAYFEFDQLVTPEKIYKVDYNNYGITSNEGRGFDGNWIREVVPFDSVYFSEPGDMKLHISRFVKQVSVDKEFPINPHAKEPQKFEFEGSEITIKNIKIGKPSSLEVEEAITEDRKFERLNFEIKTEPESPRTLQMERESVFVTEKGEKYTPHEMMEMTGTEVKKGRNYSTSTKVTMGEPNGNPEKGEILPVTMHIHSYQTTMFPDKFIEIDLPG